MSRPLWEKLQTLECHFTWDFGAIDLVDATHILMTLAWRVRHTEYRNRGAYLALRAYLLHLQGHSTEALGALREAEAALEGEHPADFARQALVAYGDYAWIYYHLTSYEEAELYLGRARGICRSLASPEPSSAAAVPEVQAQKGWSLLAVGLRNGQAARRCFRAALGGQAGSEEFRAGLATATYACWAHEWREDLREEAQRLLEGVLRGQPQNAEAQVYLASVLKRTDWRTAGDLVEEVVRHSPNPEVLRLAAKVLSNRCPSGAVSILRKAIALEPGYHLLHYDLGLCYLQMLKKRRPGNRGDLVAEAAESFRRALRAYPGSVYAKLKMAVVYGETSPAYEEEVYASLMAELPAASKRCQQAIYLHYGDFLRGKKGREQEAREMYAAAWEVPGLHPWEKRQLEERLGGLAGEPRGEGKRVGPRR